MKRSATYLKGVLLLAVWGLAAQASAAEAHMCGGPAGGALVGIWKQSYEPDLKGVMQNQQSFGFEPRQLVAFFDDKKHPVIRAILRAGTPLNHGFSKEF